MNDFQKAAPDSDLTPSDVTPSESDACYRAMFEAHPRPILLVGIGDGRVRDANEAAGQQYGRDREDFRGLHLKELWAMGFPDSVEVAGSDEGGGGLNGRWVHRTKEGATFEAEIACHPIGGESPSLAMVLVEDVSRRGRVAKFDAALSKLGRKLSEATTPRSAGRVIADISRDLIGWDACSITLYSEEKQGVVPVFAMDTVDGVLTEFPEALPAGASPNPVFQEIMNEGSRLIFQDEGEFSKTSIPFGDTARRSESLIFVPVRKGGRALGVLSIQSYQKRAYSACDVKTMEALASHCAGALERLQVQSALRIAEQRFAHAFECSPVAMFIGTIDDGRALAVNSAFVEVLGFSRDEILGKNGLELGFWDNPKDREEIYRAIRSGCDVRDVQVRFRTKSGDLRHVLVSVATIEVEGEECLLFFNYDITARVELESQLRQSQKLESIGQVTAGVAHDFNNLLTVIDGCSSLALAKESLDKDSRDLLEQISFAAERAGNLTRQLLAFSSRQKMIARDIDINRLLTNLEKMLQQLLGSAIILELRRRERLPLVSADPGMIEQVVVNLVVNARDSMVEGGWLLIETTVCDVAEGDFPKISPGHYVCLRVSDSGCGISPGNLTRLFEPFFTTKEMGKGSGLGLATAYGIVKQHGGWIDVRSQIGQGTTFMIYLPCRKGAENAGADAPPADSTEIQKGRERVLVVEDDPAVRDLSSQILRYYGYQTLEADSGSAGVEVWKKHSHEIDAVVTDIVMPGGMDGREMARLLLGERPELPILYISGYSSGVAGEEVPLQAGVNFLQKPFEAAALARAVRIQLDRRVAGGEAE